MQTTTLAKRNARKRLNPHVAAGQRACWGALWVPCLHLPFCMGLLHSTFCTPLCSLPSVGFLLCFLSKNVFWNDCSWGWRGFRRARKARTFFKCFLHFALSETFESQTSSNILFLLAPEAATHPLPIRFLMMSETIVQKTECSNTFCTHPQISVRTSSAGTFF